MFLSQKCKHSAVHQEPAVSWRFYYQPYDTGNLDHFALSIFHCAITVSGPCQVSCTNDTLNASLAFGGFACVWWCFGLLLWSFGLRNNRLLIYSLGFNNHHGNYQKPQLHSVAHLHLLFQCCLLSFIMEMG